MPKSPGSHSEHTVDLNIGDVTLSGTLHIPTNAKGIVIFAHGSGSSRFSPRNLYVAKVLREHKIATLLFDLLSKEEEAIDMETAELRFNIELLAKRLHLVMEWTLKNPATKNFTVGFFGASTGAGAALVAASHKNSPVKAVVSRGGRPDLAGKALAFVKAPTLLIVGGDDTTVIALNKDAMAKMSCEKKLEIIPGATHLFEESGALEKVAQLAAAWFQQYLQ